MSMSMSKIQITMASLNLVIAEQTRLYEMYVLKLLLAYRYLTDRRMLKT